MTFSKKYKYSSFWGIYIIVFLFGSPNILLATQSLTTGSFYAVFLNLFHFVVTSGIILLPLVIFKFSVRKFFLIVSPLFVLTPILLFIAIIYHRLPTRSIFYLMFELQKVDISEFLSGMLFWKFLIVICPMLIILISITLIDSKLVLEKKFKQVYFVFYIVLFVFTVGFKTIQRKTFNKTFQASYRTFLRDTPIHSAKRFIKALMAFKNENNPIITSTNIEVTRTIENNSREIFLLVLGESSRYKNWAINGYYRNTSPNLSKQSNLISYKNIISTSFNTNKSIPTILTNQKANNINCNNEVVSLTDIFKHAGFKSYWLSGQSSKGTILGALANDSDEVYETNFHNTPDYDGALLKQVTEILNRNEPKILLIIHSWGSHYPYQKRYPKEFETFKPSIKKNNHIPTNKKHIEAIINSYDNSILYTDYFLSELIQLINSDTTSSFLTYLSDHGENLFDMDNIGFGRGYGKVSSELFHIPLFFWASEKFISENRPKWEILNANRSALCTTEGIIYTLTDLAKINWNESDSSLSLASRYLEQNNRFVMLNKGITNYDAYFTTNTTRD